MRYMDSLNVIRNIGQNIRHQLTENKLANNLISDEVVLINIHRMYYVALIAIFMHITVVLIFSSLSPISTSEIKWQSGIMTIHGIEIGIMGIFAACFFFLKKNPSTGKWIHFLQFAFIVNVILIGISIASVDQYVTTNITPIMVIIVVSGVVFLMRPALALLVYFSTFVLYDQTIGLYQAESAIVFTNKINGIAMVCLGFCVSLIVWKTNRMTLQQEKKIEKQQQELEVKNQELERLAYFDTLTQLYTRRKWLEFAGAEIERDRRYGHESTVIMLDIDHFKKINDEYGHLIGDVVLIEVANILKGNLRDVDKASRWGGEEFVILLPQTSLGNAKTAAEKLRHNIENTTLNVDNYLINITASFGVTLLTKQEDWFFKSFEQVDQSLYRAKQNGRNRVEAYDLQSSEV